MVDLRLGLAIDSLCRDLESFARRELSRDESREVAGEDWTGATGRYCDEYCLQKCKHDGHIVET
jgi:hypothetical protein